MQIISDFLTNEIMTGGENRKILKTLDSLVKKFILYGPAGISDEKVFPVVPYTE